MSEQITPRKRRAGGTEVLESTSSATKGKAKGAPIPNPPLAPFPTPPSSRRNRAKFEHVPPSSSSRSKIPNPDFTNLASSSSAKTGVLSTAAQSQSESKSPISLPAHLQTLLTLHKAFNLALSLHIATRPPVLPPHSPETVLLELPNLTNLLAIKETVERTGGRRFGIAELGRLAWLWTWDHLSPSSLSLDIGSKSSDGYQNQTQKEDDNPFLVRPSHHPEKDNLKGMSYLLTSTRTIDPSGKKVPTYGIGITLDLKPGETRQILQGGGEGGLGNKGQGGGMGAIGRWNTLAEGREDLFKEKLEKWVEIHGGFQESLPTNVSGGMGGIGLPTPGNSRDRDGAPRSSIPPIPIMALPKLSGGNNSLLLPSVNFFSTTGVTTQAGLSSSPLKKTIPSTTGPVGLEDPFVLDEGKTKPVAGKGKTGSIDARKQAMMDRIKARSGNGKQPLATLGSSITHRKLPLTAAEQQEALKRRSTLSRLESVAEGVWMMFSATAPTSSSSTPGRASKRKAIPLLEAAELIVKSSKTPISTAEASTSLQLLSELCPFFLNVKVVTRVSWICLGRGIAPPPSPSREDLPAVILEELPPMWTPPNDSGRDIISRITGGSRGDSNGEDENEEEGRARATTPTPSSSSRTARGIPQSPKSPRSPGLLSSGRFEKSLLPPVLSGPASPSRLRRGGGGLWEVRERIRKELERA